MMPSRKESRFDNIVAMKGAQETSFIGKLVYFTIGRCLIKEKKFNEILDNCDISRDLFSTSYTSTHAFKSATKTLERKVKEYDHGKLNIYNIRILDNKREDGGDTVVREIKKEIIGERQNTMIYLGNFIHHQDAVKRNLEKLKLAELNQTTLLPTDLESEIEFQLNPTVYGEVNFDLYAECEKIVKFY